LFLSPAYVARNAIARDLDRDDAVEKSAQMTQRVLHAFKATALWVTDPLPTLDTG
jgi:hypothetical protein